LPRAKYGRMLAFKLNGKGQLPSLNSGATREVPNTASANVKGDIERGRADYDRVCASCHGANAVSPTAIPDLRYSRTVVASGEFNSIVIDGARAEKGMVSFSPVLKPEDVENIRTYLVSVMTALRGTTR